MLSEKKMIYLQTKKSLLKSYLEQYLSIHIKSSNKLSVLLIPICAYLFIKPIIDSICRYKFRTYQYVIVWLVLLEYKFCLNKFKKSNI